MDVFALQEELDAAKVARATHARHPAAAPAGGAGRRGEGPGLKGGDAGGVDAPSHIGHSTVPQQRGPDEPPQLIRDDDCGVVMTATPLHPQSAEYKLRLRYLVFTDEIIGRGGFGEVLLSQMRDVPLTGTNHTFIPIQVLLAPNVSSRQHPTTSGTVRGGGGGWDGTLGSPMSSPQMNPQVHYRNNGSFDVLPPALPASLLHHQQLPQSTHHGLSTASVLSINALSVQLRPGTSMQAAGTQPSFASQPALSSSPTSSYSKVLPDIPFFAVKKIDKSKTSHKNLNQLFSEVETLSLLNHSNVVRLQEVFQDQQYMFIVMEYVKGGELGKVLKRVGHFSEAVARKICLSILLGLEYIHDKGIVHRDMKPANCLLTKETIFSSSTAFHFAQLHAQSQSPDGGAEHGEGGGGGGRDGSAMLLRSPVRDEEYSPTMRSSSPPSRTDSASPLHPPPHHNALAFTVDDFAGLKLADFGFAAMVGRAECLTTYCGTMHFMAPEVIGREGTNYGKPVDMWSFGVIVYNLLAGELPFTASSTERLAEAIGAGNVTFPPHSKTGEHIWAAISPQAKDFIQKLLVVEPTRRFTAQEALRHPWIRAEYSNEDLGDYPTTKGILRAHSNFIRHRTLRHRFLGAVQAIIAAHRLVFFARLQCMRREGIAEIPLLRHFPFIVHGVYEPPNHIAAASSKRFANNMPALKRLAEMVAASNTVEVLDVSGNNIDDLGIVQLIVKVSFAHPSLVHLNMERNPIPALAARALIRLARSPTHRLNIINVNHTKLGVDVIAQIDGCLKETIRKRAEAAQAASTTSASGSPTYASPIVASSSILRHDGNAIRIGLMQSLTSSTGAAGAGARLAAGALSPARTRAVSPGMSSPQMFRPSSVLSNSGSSNARSNSLNVALSTSPLMSPSLSQQLQQRNRLGHTSGSMPTILIRRQQQGQHALPPLQHPTGAADPPRPTAATTTSGSPAGVPSPGVSAAATSINSSASPSSTATTIRQPTNASLATGSAANVARLQHSAQRR